MAFAVLEKLRPGIGHNKCSAWYSVPCMSLGKSALALNDEFSAAYGIEAGSHLHIFVDADSYKIGFRKAQNGDATTAYKVGRRNKGRGLVLVCQRLLKKFPDRIGLTFRARLNPETRLIEIDLNKPED